MLGKTNVGGSKKAFAIIGVTYPTGSVCTCTDGTKTLTLKDTSGLGIFLIPYAATWTIMCYDGADYESSEKKVSEAVEITSKGQSESVTLTYELVLFDRGDVTDITGGWDSSGTGGSASVGTIISMSVSDDTGYAKVRTLTTKNSIDLAGFNLLVASIKSVSGDANMKVENSASVAISEAGNVSLDISKISSKQKISFEIGAWNSSTSLEISRVWLE